MLPNTTPTEAKIKTKAIMMGAMICWDKIKIRNNGYGGRGLRGIKKAGNAR